VEFVNQDLNAAINITRCAVMEKRLSELTRQIFVRQPFTVDLYKRI